MKQYKLNKSNKNLKYLTKFKKTVIFKRIGVFY